jgi:hypothetical protein
VGNKLERLEKKSIVSDNAQYGISLAVIAVLLYAVGLPAFVIFFLGAFSFFLWKLFSTGSSTETRKIFEFYLTANEILRADQRRWYGFEIHEAIFRGEKIVELMQTPPPLVYFALGALYQKNGDHALAARTLEYLFEDDSLDEKLIIHPSSDLREYVRNVRKIEREPAEAPRLSAAIRSLERLRRSKAESILADSRARSHSAEHTELADGEKGGFAGSSYFDHDPPDETEAIRVIRGNAMDRRHVADRDDHDTVADGERREAGRKPISEVLRDIYEEKIT